MKNEIRNAVRQSDQRLSKVAYLELLAKIKRRGIQSPPLRQSPPPRPEPLLACVFGCLLFTLGLIAGLIIRWIITVGK